MFNLMPKIFSQVKFREMVTKNAMNISACKIRQGGHCRGNQEKVRESKKEQQVRENSGNLIKKEKSHGKVREFKQVFRA